MKIEEKKILHLTLNKKWFDLIQSGEKLEEYREIKQYWKTRLVSYISNHSHLFNQPYLTDKYSITFKPYTHVKFVNGYGKHRLSITKPIESIRIDKGNEEWGAEKNKYYFVLKLGS